MRKLFAILGICIFTSGCSVFMAASSNDAPNLDQVRVGADRAAIDAALGGPISVTHDRLGNLVATYQFFTGDKASTGRAVTYAFLDGITLGLAELVAFPAEALQGDRNVIKVIYDRDGRASDVQREIHAAPIENPEKILGIDQKQKSS